MIARVLIASCNCTQEMVEKLRELDASKELLGVLDDRGRFFHITEEDMSALVDFCNRRGRVSLHDIVGEANRLIDAQ
jgi:DDRGK domain